LDDEGEHVAADEELGEQAHAHDRVVLGVHRAGQAPEDHVDRCRHQGGAQEREAVLHRKLRDARCIVVGAGSGCVSDDFDCWVVLLASLRVNAHVAFETVALTRGSDDERDAELHASLPRSPAQT